MKDSLASCFWNKIRRARPAKGKRLIGKLESFLTHVDHSVQVIIQADFLKVNSLLPGNQSLQKVELNTQSSSILCTVMLRVCIAKPAGWLPMSLSPAFSQFVDERQEFRA